MIFDLVRARRLFCSIYRQSFEGCKPLTEKLAHIVAD